MPKRPDLIGQLFGRLSVLGDAKTSPPKWLCRCQCGNEIFVSTSCLRSGNTTSCGCLRIENVKKKNTKHGGSFRKSEYKSWYGMIQRCTNPEHHKYHLYGGRGITVCDRWLDFKAFLEDMGPKPNSRLTIDRMDGNKGYTPNNCRWADAVTQNNNRSNTMAIYIDGRKMRLDELKRIYNSTLKTSVISRRIKRGWNLEDAFTKPLMPNDKGVKFDEKVKEKIRESHAKSAKAKRFNIEGRMLTISEVIAIYGSEVDANTLYKRLSRGWSLEEATKTPLQSNSGVYHKPRNGPFRHTEEAKERIRQKMLERGSMGPLSDEHKRKISQGNLGKKRSKEAIEKTRAAKIGVPLSKETREKLSAALKGRKISPEVRERMKAGQINRRAREKSA